MTGSCPDCSMLCYNQQGVVTMVTYCPTVSNPGGGGEVVQIVLCIIQLDIESDDNRVKSTDVTSHSFTAKCLTNYKLTS